MPIARQSASVLAKYQSGGGENFGIPARYMQSTFGPGSPMYPIQNAKDADIPRSIDYPISVNATLTPRIGFGLMPFAALYQASELVAECKIPVQSIARELSSWIPHLIDHDGNEVHDHPYQWMCEWPNRKWPFSVWVSRFLKSAKIYDAPALYFKPDDNGGASAIEYIDGSTLFVIVDETGNIPAPEPVDEYVRRMVNRAVTPRTGNQIPMGSPDPVNSIQEFVTRYVKRQQNGQDVPLKIPAFTQIIKGTPFAWWSADDIWYIPQSPRTNAPYGESFIENAWAWVQVIANITAFELAHYRTGNMPEGIVTVPRDMFPNTSRIQAAEELFNFRMTSNPATERNRLRVFPDGTKWFQTKKPDFPLDLYQKANKIILNAIGLLESEYGETGGGEGLGGKGFKEGAESDSDRITFGPQATFVATPFNAVLKRAGVTDVTFELVRQLREVDPDKQRQAVYDGMAHGTLSLNDALSELNMPPIGDPDDKDNLANKHLIVAGSAIYVIEDMQTQNGMAVPTFGAKPGGAVGGEPAGPETAVEQVGAEHTPQDMQTLKEAIRAIQDKGTLTTKFYSAAGTENLAKAKSGKRSQASVEYTSYATNTSERCSLCRFFIPEKAGYVSHCQLVEGPISQDGWCKLFEPSPTNDKAQIVGDHDFTKVDATHTDDAMIAIMIPSDAANQLRLITERIGLPSRATLEPASSMHVTLAYLPDAASVRDQYSVIADSLTSLAVDVAVMNGKIQGFGVFNGQDGQKVLFALLDEVQLPALREAICKALDGIGIEYGKDHGFVPHVTMAYFPESFELSAGFAVPDIPCMIDHVTLAIGDAHTDILFRGSKTTDDVTVTKLAKHCGVCAEDDAYFGAPIARELPFDMPIDHHANDAEIVAMCPAGLPPKAAIWKPEGGENPSLQSYIGGPQYLREEAAYLLDRSLGFFLVPVAYVASADDEQGAAVYYTSGLGDGQNVDQYDPAWIEKGAVLDYVMGQRDRGSTGHNFGTHPDDPTRPVLFDNGLSFATDPSYGPHSGFCTAFAGQPLSDDTLAALTVCKGDASVWSDIGALVGSIAARNALTRLQTLLEEKSMPGDDESVFAAEVNGTNGSWGL